MLFKRVFQKKVVTWKYLFNIFDSPKRELVTDNVKFKERYKLNTNWCRGRERDKGFDFFVRADWVPGEHYEITWMHFNVQIKRRKSYLNDDISFTDLRVLTQLHHLKIIFKTIKKRCLRLIAYSKNLSWILELKINSFMLPSSLNLFYILPLNARLTITSVELSNIFIKIDFQAMMMECLL